MKCFLAVWFACFRQVPAPVPCKPTLAADVQVGDVQALIGPSRTILHLEVEERDCAIVTFGYEGMIVITCDEGSLNVTAEGCTPRRCQPEQSITVRLGEYSVSASPLQTIASGGQELRFCRNLNPLFRNTYIMYCNYGEVTVDTSQCVTQWDPMTSPPWSRRSRVGSVGLSDGAVLMLGGLGNEGPIREVWLWQPTPGTLAGSWHQSEKLPPWSGRFGSAAVRLSSEQQEQVVLMGGNDNQNRDDVWRWLRHPEPIELSLGDSQATGTQAQDCVLETSQLLLCHAKQGVSGRKWDISHYLEMSTEIHIDLLHGGGTDDLPTGAAGVGAAVIAIELDNCRQLFRAEGGRWSTTGCTGDQPPWARADQPAIRLGPNGAAFPGQLRSLRFVLDRERREVVMYSDNVLMTPAGADPGQLGVPVGGGVCRDYSNMQNGSLVCPDVQEPVSVMHLRVVELVVWPEASLEVRRLAVMAPAGFWQPLADIAPWPARAAHVAVPLPDGDILLMGGVGESGLLNDVWRWTRKRCTLLEDIRPLEAARFGLECSYKCRDSPIYGQWAQLLDAPWAPREEPAALLTTSGVILAGGRAALGYTNDVWLWQHSGDFCSAQWQGVWSQLTPQASWLPRHGHRLVGFAGETGEVETVLLVGGFGGEPFNSEVIRGEEQDPAVRPNPRNDIWCGNKNLQNWGQWTQMAPSAPFSARAQFGAVIAPTISDFSFVLFGGYDDNARLVADQWRWTGENTTFTCDIQEPASTL